MITTYYCNILITGHEYRQYKGPMPMVPIHQLALLFHSLGTGYRQSIFFYATLAYHSTPPTHTTFIIMRASLAIPLFCLAASITPSFAVSMKCICLFCGATDVDPIFQT